MGGVTLERGRQGDGELDGFVASQVLGTVAKIVLRGRLGAIDAVAELDDVEVDLHDAFLAPKALNEKRIIGLDAFAEHGARMRQEGILGGLLADGAAAAETASGVDFAVSLLHLLDVETVVVHEEAVLGIDNGGDEMGRDIVDGDVIALEAHVSFGAKELLTKALHHQRREWRIEDDAEEDLEEGEEPEPHDDHPDEAEDASPPAYCAPGFEEMPLLFHRRNVGI